jgi:hypothetical protein
MKSLSSYRIEVGFVFIFEIDDLIAAQSYRNTIRSKFIELVHERLLNWYDESLVGC